MKNIEQLNGTNNLSASAAFFFLLLPMASSFPTGWLQPEEAKKGVNERANESTLMGPSVSVESSERERDAEKVPV